MRTPDELLTAAYEAALTALDGEAIGVVVGVLLPIGEPEPEGQRCAVSVRAWNRPDLPAKGVAVLVLRAVEQWAIETTEAAARSGGAS